jgi:hypothetical protein
VSEERSLLEEIIRELNITWSKTLGIRLELVKWETHAYPDVAADPQAVINKQIPDDHDIFIGIMWSRFGTPTGRSGSGTTEEFERAYSRHREHPDTLTIMFYFKDAPISPTKIDIIQLGQVNSFREKLGKMGSLYWNFSAPDEFSQLLRLHLSRVVQEWKKRMGDAPATTTTGNNRAIEVEPSPVSLSGIPEQTSDELGFLDYIEIGNSSLMKAADSADRITAVMNDLTLKTNARTEEMTAITAKQPIDIKAAKRVANASAQDLDDFCARMQPELPVLKNAFKEGVESLGKAAAMITDFQGSNKENTRPTHEQVQRLLHQLEGYQNSMAGFRDSLIKLPRLTGSFNKAKTRAIALLDSVIEDAVAFRKITTETDKLLSELF